MKGFKSLRAADLRGVAQLATQATLGVARIAEGVHQSVWSTLGAPGGRLPGQTRGITGLVYRSIHGVTRLVGRGADRLLTQLQDQLASAPQTPGETPRRAALLAVLNGVLGDHLADSNNPLATPMTLRLPGGEALDWAALPTAATATAKVVVLIHGLCMNDLQWHTGGGTEGAPTVDHGEALVALGYTPLYLRYNTGLHTSHNGAGLSALLEQLTQRWPVPVEDLTVVAHSMGGLLIRSAVYQAQHTGLGWPGKLKNIVFLGTPHHGAPLERAGNWVDVILGSMPYTRPFARLGHLRSAGITDLRYGHLLEADWGRHDRFHRKPDNRQPVPLPANVACYAIAATLGTQSGTLADRLLGDGLVPLRSALGQHKDPQRTLAFAADAQWIGYRMGHLQLLSSAEVTRHIVRWLGAAP